MLGKALVDVVKSTHGRSKSRSKVFEAVCRRVKRLGVAVETDDINIIAGLQQSLGVAATADGCIENRPWRNFGKHVNDFLSHHGVVRERSLLTVCHRRQSCHTRGFVACKSSASMVS